MNVCDPVILFLMEGDSLDVVKDTQEVGLDGVGVRSLPKDLKQGWVRDEEEPREHEPLLLQVAREGLLTELQLLQEVGEELAQCFITHTACDHVRGFVGLCQNLHPRFVNVAKSLGFLHVSVGGTVYESMQACVCVCVCVCTCMTSFTIGSCLAMSPPTNTASR